MKSLRRVFSEVSKPDPDLAPPTDTPVPFEGVEKRLLCFFDSMLSDMTEAEWQVILDHAHCEIVSKKTLRDTTVYLLSESTLTVWPNGFLLKTCGRTTPFLAFEALSEAYGKQAFLSSLQWMCYSRLDFLYPEHQVWPHQTADQEAKFMRSYLPQVQQFTLEAGPHTMHGLFFGRQCLEPFRTEEVLLMQIHPNCVRHFTGFDTPDERDGNDDGSNAHGVVRAAIGARDMPDRDCMTDHMPDHVCAELDEFWFSPWGYSCNALKTNIDADLDYFSCHVSPEPATSYASLEIGKRGNNSAVSTDAKGLAFRSLIPPFLAKTLHFTSLQVTSSSDSLSEDESYAEAISSINVGSSNYNLAHSSTCQLVFANTRAILHHQVFIASESEKWTIASSTQGSTLGSDTDFE